MAKAEEVWTQLATRIPKELPGICHEQRGQYRAGPRLRPGFRNPLFFEA